MGQWNPPPTASETITECKGCSMLCDITVCDYWSFCFRGWYWNYDSGNIRPFVQVINIFLTQDLARFPQVNGNKWFQGNEVTLQTATNLISAARHLCSDHVLLRNGDNSWPARSRDLSPCDSYLGLLKEKIVLLEWRWEFEKKSPASQCVFCIAWWEICARRKRKWPWRRSFY
jgi:hypothetical protein